MRLALYVSHCPQHVAGPIVRYGHVARQLGERNVKLDGFAVAVFRDSLATAPIPLLTEQFRRSVWR